MCQRYDRLCNLRISRMTFCFWQVKYIYSKGLITYFPSFIKLIWLYTMPLFFFCFLGKFWLFCYKHKVFFFKEKAILSLIRVYFHCYQNLLSNRPKEFFCMSTCRKSFVLSRSLRYFLSQFLVQINFCKFGAYIVAIWSMFATFLKESEIT